MLSNRIKKRIALFSLAAVAAVSFRPTEAQANPAALAAPAACSTGVLCIVVGAVVIGGVTYTVWQNSKTGQRYHVPAPRVMPSRSRYDANQFAGRRKRDRVVNGQGALPGVLPKTPVGKRSAVTTLDACIKANRGKRGWEWKNRSNDLGRFPSGEDRGLCIFAK